jgi:hypothetical protein
MSQRARQLPLSVCNLCGGHRRLSWVTGICQCEWGEGQCANQRAAATDAGLTVALPVGTHAHGAWLCVKCRQRAIDWKDVAIRTGTGLVNPPTRT